jgi:hypothetical protein
MDDAHRALAERIAARFARLPEVEAVAVAGSQTSQFASAGSDIDLYIYPAQDIPADVRMAIAAEFASHPVLNDFWGPGVEWDDAETGLRIDSMYFTTGWMQEQVERCVLRHEAWLGYTTAFWHTVRQSRPLFDRSGWFARLQALADQPYPDALVRNIVRTNRALLRAIPSSYRTQIDKAAARGDLVSLNHRIAALLASYFDIVFAANRQTHPGEKRLIQVAVATCATLPEGMGADVERLLRAAMRPEDAVPAVDALVDRLEAWLANHEALLSGA